jgi:FAD/FMN-containing dehydrogenase
MIVTERFSRAPALSRSSAGLVIAAAPLAIGRSVRESELTAWHAFGGIRGWLGVVLTIAFVAFPMGSSLAPVAAHWWPAAASLKGVLTLALVLWTLGLVWCLQAVMHQLENERHHLRAA